MGAAADDPGGGARRLVAALALALALVGAVVWSAQRPQGTDAASRASTTVARPTTTTTSTTSPTVRLQARMLAGYCDRPSEAWPEVPRYRPGDPVRTFVRQDADTTGNGFDGDVAPAVANGSTVISPHPDGRLLADASVLARTRAVTCVTFGSAVRTGRTCRYGAGSPSPGSRSASELASNRWRVVVYELHSGAVLHQGEIATSTSHCPRHRYAHRGSSGTVAFILGRDDVLAWFARHFAEGTPH